MSAQLWPLAYAQQTDLSGSDVKVTVLCLAALGVVAILSLIVIAVARARIPRRSQGVVVAAVIWSLIAAASIIQPMLAHMHWSSEQDLLLKTGYYEPTQAAPAPAYPSALWLALAVAYALALLAMLMVPKKNATTPR